MWEFVIIGFSWFLYDCDAQGTSWTIVSFVYTHQQK